MKQIIIDVDAAGIIFIETKGYTGMTCIEESEFLKKALGKEIEQDLKPIAYTENGNKVKHFLPLCG